ncbi:hypothetical protein EVAR_31533_1 [Eumeta japonica]|uniref:Uncharacterized protein n=1 Tax=Eumeta variegata TaxID=151549 RepID=A0A4C1V9S3_EUMVA|nr:hypothetical protein EVAR_31533_1 [Eumeta japonica]
MNYGRRSEPPTRGKLKCPDATLRRPGYILKANKRTFRRVSVYWDDYGNRDERRSDVAIVILFMDLISIREQAYFQASAIVD